MEITKVTEENGEKKMENKTSLNSQIKNKISQPCATRHTTTSGEIILLEMKVGLIVKILFY